MLWKWLKIFFNFMKSDLIIPKSYDQLERFANIVAKSSIAPKTYQGKPSDCLIAMMYGHELGLKPLQSLNGVSVINGKPCIYGDTLVALCRASGDLECLKEEIIGEGDNMKAVCIVKRKGDPEEKKYEFSVSDAKLANLWDTRKTVERLNKYKNVMEEQHNTAPWYCYPKRMLQMRARGFALRDVFADKLQGMITAEEARDYPVDVTPTKREDSLPISSNTHIEDSLFTEYKNNLESCENKKELSFMASEISKQRGLLSQAQAEELRHIYTCKKEFLESDITKQLEEMREECESIAEVSADAL